MIRITSIVGARPKLLLQQQHIKRCLGQHRLLTSVRRKSSTAVVMDDEPSTKGCAKIHRLRRVRNVGIVAHVDAGKTTVTERMLALAGVVRRAGAVDDGDTVTDYLPAERERGITIQSAAISFEWGWHNNRTGDDFDANDSVNIHLIDTPGHVDFSVEVNRSVAVLDAAVLVVDAVAGVQAQTETVWKAMAMTRGPTLTSHGDFAASAYHNSHDALPCLALINKMDKVGCSFGHAIESLRKKLPGANPVPMQVPLFREMGKSGTKVETLKDNLVAIPPDDVASATGDFVGVIDIVHMRAIIWPDVDVAVADVEQCVPKVISLLKPGTHEPIDEDCPVTQEAMSARFELIEALAEVDEFTEECYLHDKELSNAELRAALRRATLARRAMPVMASAALKGKGIEPLMDSIADLLPSPLDRKPPAIKKLKQGTTTMQECEHDSTAQAEDTLGHPLHKSLLALAFKVVHMKGRGGSGDGRVVFARVYSGKIRTRDTLQVITPPAPGEIAGKPRVEKVGGMLELAGGRFDNLEEGTCKSGDVCALVGLKTVVTGDTLMLSNGNGCNGKSKSSRKNKSQMFCLAGVASPKPVLKVRVEAESSTEQKRLAEALALAAIEDPSLVVEESDSITHLSGLGELHIEVTLDRIFREHGLKVMTGAPSVAYRETVACDIESPGGTFVDYDRTIGGSRMQASIHLLLEPSRSMTYDDSQCVTLSEPEVVVSHSARDFLGVDEMASEEDLMRKNEVFKALVQGCQGALKRGPLSAYGLANVKCHVVDIDSEGGLSGLQALPGALRAAAAHAVSVTLADNISHCAILEPTMSVEVTAPGEMVGTILSDLTARRGRVGEVIHGDASYGCSAEHAKALIHADVPLVEILGYASCLRSLTGGEAAFTAEYKGHSPYSSDAAEY